MSAVLTGPLHLVNVRTQSQSARGRQWQAFGSALGLEVALVAAVLGWMAAHPATPPEQVIPLSIETTVPAATEKTPEPEKPKLVRPPEQPLPIPKPPARASTPPPLEPIAPLSSALVATPAPATPALQPVAASISPPAPAPIPVSAPTIDPTPAYNAKLTAAAQAAFEVPGTVAALNFKGRARVGFKLRDGLASSIAIVQSSGLGAMDRAALKAVQTAAFPQPPPALQAKEMAYEIWVTHAPAN